MRGEPLEVRPDRPEVSRGEAVDGSVVVDEADGLESVEVKLEWAIEGRGPDETEVVDRTNLDPSGVRGREALAFSLSVPRNGPRSYPGDLFRVVWRVRARGVRPGFDRRGEAVVEVDPRVPEPVARDTVEIRVPPPEATAGVEIPGGRDLDSPPTREAWTPKQMLIGFVAVLAALGVVAWMVRDVLELVRLPSLPWSSTGTLVLVGALALVPLGLIGLLLRRAAAERILGPVEFRPLDRSPSRGDRARLMVRFQPRKRAVLDRIDLRLRCREKVVVESGSGADRTEWASHDDVVRVTTELARGRELEPGRTESFVAALPVPPGAPPTFRQGSDHSVYWLAEVAVRLRRAPDWTADAFVQVR